MELKFSGDLTGLQQGINILSNEANYKLSENGMLIFVEKSENGIEVIYENNRATIRYKEKIHLR
jgi:hypothetical protein